jgi:hypothetical protein
MLRPARLQVGKLRLYVARVSEGSHLAESGLRFLDTQQADQTADHPVAADWFLDATRGRRAFLPMNALHLTYVRWIHCGLCVSSREYEPPSQRLYKCQQALKNEDLDRIQGV